MGRGWRSARAAIATSILLVCAIAQAPACRAPTQITVEIFTDIKCADLQGTSVTVGPLAGIETRQPEATTRACTDQGRIGSLGVVPRGEPNEEIVIRVVSGFGGDVGECSGPAYGPSCVVARRALRFLPQESLYVPIRMTAACKGVPCGTSATCVNGTCLSAVVDPTLCVQSGGCGEDILSPGGPPPASDAGIDSPVAPCTIDTCGFDVPPSWSLVTLGPRTSPCPSGLTPRDVVHVPAAGAGACACGACSVAPTTCTNGLTLQTIQEDGAGVCNVNTAALGSNNGACTPFAGNLLATTGVRPIQFPNRACTSPGTGVPDGGGTPARLCSADPACTSGACRNLAPDQRTCIQHEGDVPCPAPLTKTRVADAVSVTCPACDCRVDVRCPGTLTFYDDGGCTLNPRAVAATGVCFSYPSPVTAYRWAPGTMQLTSCVTAPGSATSVTPTGPRTICCR
jgi:hypothetical protein